MEVKNKYIREISSVIEDCDTTLQVDVYDVLEAFDVRCGAVAHGIKKLLCPGIRGGKGRLQDLEEALICIKRAIGQEKKRIKKSKWKESGQSNPNPTPSEIVGKGYSNTEVTKDMLIGMDTNPSKDSYD